MKINLPSFKNYGNYSSDNYGVNSLMFSIGNLEIYFSYKTPIAFWHPSTGFVIRVNDWSTTTGKHLNWINKNHSKRISGDEFEKQLTLALEK